MNQQTHHTIQAFVDQAINQAVTATERQYSPEIALLESQLTDKTAYQRLAALLAQEKGDVARSAFLTGLRYGLAMAHIANPSLFVQVAGIAE